jgi:hypothetical protein
MGKFPFFNSNYALRIKRMSVKWGVTGYGNETVTIGSNHGVTIAQ